MTDSPTYWLPSLHKGDEEAVERLWKDYFVKIIRLAKRRMDGLKLGAVDEEDVALSAMNSFCRMAKNREEPIPDSKELWKLLSTIVKRKVGKERQRQGAAKRQEHRVRSESVLVSSDMEDGDRSNQGLVQIPGNGPSPELAAELAETCEFILGLPQAEKLVTLKFEGYSNSEIAEKLDCSTRTVQRELKKMLDAWEAWQKRVRDEWESHGPC